MITASPVVGKAAPGSPRRAETTRVTGLPSDHGCPSGVCTDTPSRQVGHLAAAGNASDARVRSEMPNASRVRRLETHLRSLGLPPVQRPRATGSRRSAGVRETQLVRAVGARVFVEDISGVRDVHVANAARTARGPDRGAIHAHPLPMTQ